MRIPVKFDGASLLFLVSFILMSFGAGLHPGQSQAPAPIAIQNLPPAAPQSAESAQAPPAEEEAAPPMFEVEVQVVTVPVTVTDRDGNFVTDLNPTDFRILDNGKQQRIENFELSFDPLSMVVVVQTSGRVAKALEEIKRSGILFTQLILGETGEAAIITFDREVRLAQDFTSDPEKIESTLKNIKAGTDEVHLSDAVSRALTILQRRGKGRRKVAVVISEARDTGSSATAGFVLRGAQQMGISVYTVSLDSVRGMIDRTKSEGPAAAYPAGVIWRPGPANAPPTPDTQIPIGTANLNILPLIEELVTYTKNLLGGNHMKFYATGSGAADFSSNNMESLENAITRIGQELRDQYMLTYRPNNLDKPSFHHILVQAARPGEKLNVRTRPGYMYTRGGKGAAAPPPPSNVR
ncbi:MAG: VWA domain-containing protein [Acidobacteria bacterium]|nr:VWA domain-containing protein [Acidobacteriota bacterium]